MADKLVTIAQLNYIEADLARQLLADCGIASIVNGLEFLGGHVELQVFESKAKQALEILESQERQEQ